MLFEAPTGGAFDGKLATQWGIDQNFAKKSNVPEFARGLGMGVLGTGIRGKCVFHVATGCDKWMRMFMSYVWQFDSCASFHLNTDSKRLLWSTFHGDSLVVINNVLCRRNSFELNFTRDSETSKYASEKKNWTGLSEKDKIK